MIFLNLRNVALTTVLSAICFTPAIADSSAQTVHVGLGGEAGSPMSVKIDAAKVPAGEVIFEVNNEAIGTDHEVVLVKLAKPDQKILVTKGKNKIDESKLKSMGEVAGLKPGATGTLKVKLAAGNYMLLCNHRGHYEAGMYTPLTVVE